VSYDDPVSLSCQSGLGALWFLPAFLFCARIEADDQPKGEGQVATRIRKALWKEPQTRYEVDAV
jgi:hypothetical protein